MAINGLSINMYVNGFAICSIKNIISYKIVFIIAFKLHAIYEGNFSIIKTSTKLCLKEISWNFYSWKNMWKIWFENWNKTLIVVRTLQLGYYKTWRYGLFQLQINKSIEQYSFNIFIRWSNSTIQTWFNKMVYSDSSSKRFNPDFSRK